MDDVFFVPSAFRHGYREEDFYQVLAGRYLKLRSGKGLQAVYEILGQNLAGTYLHIVYRILPDGRFRVFHIARMNEKLKKRFQRLRP